MVSKCFYISFTSLQYIVVLLLLFLVQFIVACVCLAIGPGHQKTLFRGGWYEAVAARGKMQKKYDCCGAFSEDQLNDTNLPHPPCNSTSVSLDIQFCRFFKC